MKNKEKKEKVSLLKTFKNNFYMLGLAFKASPSRVAGAFGERICQQFRNIFLGIIFWEVILGFVERDADFKEVIPFLIFSAILLLLIQFF